MFNKFWTNIGALATEAPTIGDFVYVDTAPHGGEFEGEVFAMSRTTMTLVWQDDPLITPVYTVIEYAKCNYMAVM